MGVGRKADGIQRSENRMTNLAEFSEEGYGPKGAVLTVVTYMMMMMMQGDRDNLREAQLASR
jgi:hypothetical protein